MFKFLTPKLTVYFCVIFFGYISCKNSNQIKENPVSQIQKNTDIATNAKENQTENEVPDLTIPSETVKNSSESKNQQVYDTSTKPPGPKAFIVKNKVKLFEKESIDSPVKKILSKNTIIFILETSFKDDKGNVSSFPTWYKIQTEDNVTGWVEGITVSAGH